MGDRRGVQNEPSSLVEYSTKYDWVFASLSLIKADDKINWVQKYFVFAEFGTRHLRNFFKTL